MELVLNVINAILILNLLFIFFITIKKVKELFIDRKLKRQDLSQIKIAALKAIDNKDRQQKMDEILLPEQKYVEKNIGLLAVLANITTFVGLAGTLVILYNTFLLMSNQSGENKKLILAEGISLMVNMTIEALVLAVPTLIIYFILQNRATLLTDDLNRAALKLYINMGSEYQPKLGRIIL